MQIIGLHISTGRFHDEVLTFHKAVQPNYALWLEPAVDTLLAVRDVSPRTEPIGREWRGPDSAAILGDPRQAARDLVDLMRTRPDWPYIWWWVGHNEPDTYNWETFTGMAEFELRMADILHYEGKLYAGLSWSRGHPPHYWFTKAECEARDIPYFPWENLERYYYPVFEKLDAFCTHEYTFFGFLKLVNGVWIPDYADEGYWQLNRHRHWWDKLPKELQKPVFKTEGCIDAGDRRARGEQGWKAQMAPDRYLADMIACGQYMATRPEVRCYLMYQDGSTDPQWDSFAHDGEIMRMMTDTLPKTEEGGQTMQIVDLTAECQFNSGYTRQISDIRGICVHHTGSAAADANQVAYMKTKTDASYHFLIGRDGKIYQLNPITEVVWHAADGGDGPSNRGDVAVSFIGLLMDGVEPNAAQYQRFRELRQMLVGQGVGQGLTSHKQAKPAHDTDCPGDWWPLDALPPAALVGSIVVPPTPDPVPPIPATVIQRIEILERRMGEVEAGQAKLWQAMSAAGKALGGQ